MGVTPAQVDATCVHIANGGLRSCAFADKLTRAIEHPMTRKANGSHTIGTSVGGQVIGVAPEAQWISCMGLKGSGGAADKLLACAQWVVCPTDVDGTNSDCDAGVDVVNNRGARPYTTPFSKTVLQRDKCNSNGQPGACTSVIGVGAIGSPLNDPTTLAYFSSKGSATPDVSAFWTRSAVIANNTAYVCNAGTSMAAPHVTGVVALLKSYDKTLSYDDIYMYLTQTIDQEALNTTEPAQWPVGAGFQAGGANCGGVQDSEWPNNRFGHGSTSGQSCATSNSIVTRNHNHLALTLDRYRDLYLHLTHHHAHTNHRQKYPLLVISMPGLLLPRRRSSPWDACSPVAHVVPSCELAFFGIHINCSLQMQLTSNGTH
ncbi:Aste57867_15328 [Aphanomyces stellatus]|uniref:subtilisin n=1 Tax=Aphanomyces stellatus TaxID=120398 RepID=A0A485L3W6_9STRA|nr:hypothetical protein As57867_015272 [Aphanomyces stellatus]VFT92137.1 Aste57867_15328 [Aphanomyces stellatus]